MVQNRASYSTGVIYQFLLYHQCSICRWLGGLTPHWLKMTPTLVTENFFLGVGFNPPSPDPARPT